jgi:hypothetical protein
VSSEKYGMTARAGGTEARARLKRGDHLGGSDQRSGADRRPHGHQAGGEPRQCMKIEDTREGEAPQSADPRRVSKRSRILSIYLYVSKTWLLAEWHEVKR